MGAGGGVYEVFELLLTFRGGRMHRREYFLIPSNTTTLLLISSMVSREDFSLSGMTTSRRRWFCFDDFLAARRTLRSLCWGDSCLAEKATLAACSRREELLPLLWM